jgi:hypothetical protein
MDEVGMGMFVLMIVVIQMTPIVVVTMVFHFVIVMIAFMVFMTVGLTPASPSPNHEPDARKNEEPADYMALLKVDLSLEFEADNSDRPRKNQRCGHVPSRCQRADPRYSSPAPCLSPSDYRKRNPVVG